MQAGAGVVVIDNSHPFSASKVASGVINPVTGRRVVSTWMIDELLPYAWDIYNTIGDEIGSNIISQKNILAFHGNEQMQKAFVGKMDENEAYVSLVEDEEPYKKWFDFRYSIGIIDPVYLIDIQTLLSAWRKVLKDKDVLREDVFSWGDCTIDNGKVAYKDVVAEKVIMCDGTAGYYDPYFKRLPYGLTKGEALILDIPDLPQGNIYKHGYNVVPWKDGLFWVGSTFDREYDDTKPSPSFRAKVEDQLKGWLKLPYKVVDHIASERAGTLERRPFVGLHPQQKEVGIFNGMGTKGCSLAPYFADEFTQYLLHGKAINELADVQRFTKVLAR